MQLAPDGKSVTITLRLYRSYEIHKDARFVIEQSGFLGDQYVAIRPTNNEGPVFGPGDEARAEAPLDLQEVARTAAGFLQHIDSAATNVNDALSEARRTVLSVRALTNLSATFDNLHAVSERSLGIADNVGTLVESNRTAIAASVSNLLFFSEQINQSAAVVRDLLATNSPGIEESVRNIESSTATLKKLLDGVQEGRGLAGNLLENEEMAANVSQIVSNLSITTSNLNRLGLWGILWQHKPPRTNCACPIAGAVDRPQEPLRLTYGALGHPHPVPVPLHRWRLCREPGSARIRRHSLQRPCGHGHRVRLRLADDRPRRDAQGLFPARLLGDHFRPAPGHGRRAAHRSLRPLRKR